MADKYVVPKEELPSGISYKAIYGTREVKPKKTVYIQKILTQLEGSASKKGRD